ncbi:MAG TPA: VOC family protein [Thermoleophilaceae bacterium]|jgi:PhnB protein|nr:VOC family protein [Thermoleophilaceae bacterium]
MRVSAHIVVSDADRAADWYARAFGAVARDRTELPGGIVTAVLAFGDDDVHIASEFPDGGVLSPLTIGGTATVLQLNTGEADMLWSQALAAGAEVRHELADQSWGERHGQLTDPFGHRWNIAQPL